MSKQRTYLAIDLKSYYASCECAERQLDPMRTHLVVADAARTEKTICLAVSPSLKALGIPGRPRLFEVVRKIRQLNAQRLYAYRRLTGNPQARLSAPSFDAEAIAADPSLEVGYITAPPQMARYMEISTQIYTIYLRYIAPEDIFPYSIDEVFIDVTGYLDTYRLTARELAMTMIREVLYETGITATAGIGSNLYLAKIAMDIVAKHVPADRNGVRIAELDEASYRRILWGHQPLTDFWRVGHGYAKKLEAHNLHTMGDIARCSIGLDPVYGVPSPYYTEELLYKLFGVNAELLIDHAWGWEPTTMDLVKAYKPESSSLGSGQVLHCPYSYDKAELIAREMADALSLDLVGKGLTTDQLVLSVGYDRESLSGETGARYKGLVVTDHYGRLVPKPAHGSENLPFHTASTRLITEAALAIYRRVVNPDLLVRRINIVANRVISEQEAQTRRASQCEQLNLFTDYAALDEQRAAQDAALARERRLQQAMVALRQKYGKNAVLKAMNLEEGATMISRNGQIGGHKA